MHMTPPEGQALRDKVGKDAGGVQISGEGLSCSMVHVALLQPALHAVSLTFQKAGLCMHLLLRLLNLTEFPIC